MNVAELIVNACERGADRAALAQGDRTLTYTSLLGRAARCANMLDAAPGERVAVFLTDTIESVEIFAGVALSGATLVPINARFLAAEASHVIADSGARTLVYSPPLAGQAHAIDGFGELRTIEVGAAYETLLAAASPSYRPAPIRPDDIAVIGYTSGTTGFPKGALCSHRAVTNCARLVPYVQGMVTGGTGTFTGSFSFVSALWGILYPHLWTGATLRLCDPSDIDGWFAAIARDRSTYTWVPSPLVRTFREHLERNRELLDHLLTVVHTGSKVPREFLADLVDVIGPRLVETWGLTESVGPLTATTRADFAGCGADDLFASVGRPVPTAQVRMLDSGELAARGDTMFSGYLHRDPDDPEFAVDGWFRTGDVGRIDDAGYVYIEDRAKDMIVSGGMNVYSAEVEMAIATLPGVVECAVFALPHDRWGETVAAAVVAQPGRGIDADAVIDHVRARLASYKKPTAVFFVDALPRNASMKVQKQALSAMVAAGLGRQV